jgi:hypothetical protein
MARTFHTRTDRSAGKRRPLPQDRLECGDCHRVFPGAQTWYRHLDSDGYCPALARVVNLHSGRISYA